MLFNVANGWRFPVVACSRAPPKVHLRATPLAGADDHPIRSMVLVYQHDWGILMGSMLPYIAYMNPMGYTVVIYIYEYI